MAAESAQIKLTHYRLLVARQSNVTPFSRGRRKLCDLTPEDATATAATETLQAKMLSTGLTVNDVQQSIRFFEGLGFTVGEKWEHEGKLLGVMMKAGEAQIGLSQDDWKKGRDRRQEPSAFRITLARAS